MEYKHGGDIYTNEGMLDFSVNVNPFGASESVKTAARESVEFISDYPDSYCRKLRSALAEKLQQEMDEGCERQTIEEMIDNASVNLRYTALTERIRELS